jgi:hypothetical protein
MKGADVDYDCGSMSHQQQLEFHSDVIGSSHLTMSLETQSTPQPPQVHESTEHWSYPNRRIIMSTYTDIVRDGKGRDVQHERLVGHGKVLHEVTDEDPSDVPRGLSQAGGVGGRVRGRDFVP